MDIGPTELIIILVIVILLFGPGRVANLGRELGASIRQFREGMKTPPDSEEAESTDPKDSEESKE